MADPLEYPRLRFVDAFPTEVEGEQRICLRDPMSFTDRVLLVPYPVFFLLATMDGTRSIADVRAAFNEKFKHDLPLEKIREIVRMLDENLFLDGKRFQDHFQALVREFRSSRVREAIHAGGAYDEDPAALRSAFDAFFTHPEGPGSKRPEPGSAKRPLRGLIAPHVDPRRGGPCYAHAYREVMQLEPADTYVVFGTSHAPMKRLFAATRKAYETPFGALDADPEILDALEKRFGESLFEDEFNHRAEHSIEFQAVFLRYAFEGRPAPRLVPILCGSLHRCIETGKRPSETAEFTDLTSALRETLKGRSVCIVAGADLAHVGQKFGDADAPTTESLAALESDDVSMMRCLESLDTEGFFRSVHGDQDRRRICGFSPILATLASLEARDGKLLRYSQVLEQDTGSVVTYASMAFYG